MNKLDTFMENIRDQVLIKTEKLHINSKIIKVEHYNNLILVEVPGFYTYTRYVAFRGEHRNEIALLLDISEYLDEGIKSVFLGDVEISDDLYIKDLEKSCDYYSEEL